MEDMASDLKELDMQTIREVRFAFFPKEAKVG